MDKQLDTLIALKKQEIQNIEQEIQILMNLKIEMDKIQKTNAEFYRNHIENSAIHKKPLDDNARDKGNKTIVKNAKNTRKKIVQWIEHYLFTTGEKEVDMSRLIAEVGTSESTVRNLMREIKSGAFGVPQQNFITFWNWVHSGCKFKNVPNFHK